ncbi:MAG: Ig-like domain-containing protein [Bacteroidia bacterium]|nr:Ig-like domain-containing protein [Bacteroidia bacterium]
MKRKNVFLSAFLVTAMFAVMFSGCKKDSGPTDFTLSALMAGTIDLNGATSPNTVPVNPSIVATFNTDVDLTTALPANVSLVQEYDNAVIALTVAASGKTITVTPTENLGNGASYKLTLQAGFKSSGGLALTEVVRKFTTVGAFVPKGAVAHWNFEDNANDVVGTYNPSASGIVAVTYTASRNAAAGKAATFDGATSIIEIPNGDQLMNTHDFTLSFWAKAVNSGKGHFIIGLAAFYGFQFELNGGFTEFKMPVQFDYGDGTSGTGGDLVYNGDGKTKDNGGYRGTTFSKENTALVDVLKEKWFHITYVYNSATKERMFFLNGELVKTQDHNLFLNDLGQPTKEMGITGLKYGGVAPETVNELAFGFIQSRAGTLWDDQSWGGYDKPGANHFQGQLDDVRITEIDVILQMPLFGYLLSISPCSPCLCG